jgi:hypothetical protein
LVLSTFVGERAGEYLYAALTTNTQIGGGGKAFQARDQKGGGEQMSKEIEDKIKEGLINSAPDKEGADWVKSAIEAVKLS